MNYCGKPWVAHWGTNYHIQYIVSGVPIHSFCPRLCLPSLPVSLLSADSACSVDLICRSGTHCVPVFPSEVEDFFCSLGLGSGFSPMLLAQQRFLPSLREARQCFIPLSRQLLPLRACIRTDAPAGHQPAALFVCGLSEVQGEDPAQGGRTSLSIVPRGSPISLIHHGL